MTENRQPVFVLAPVGGGIYRAAQASQTEPARPGTLFIAARSSMATF